MSTHGNVTAADIDSTNDEQDDHYVDQPPPSASGGFIAPVDNQNPFTPAPDEIEADRTPSAPRPTRDDGVIRTSDAASRKKKASLIKGKLLKILKGPHETDALHDEDPEEEKLKMLQDCCETICQNRGFEIDDTRKKMSSEWFAQINLAHSERKQLCFAESLLIMEDNGETVGKMYCHVTPSKWNNRACLCVNSESYGKFSTGLEAGTTITSFVDFKVKPLQEYVYEWASLDGETIERKTLLIDEVERIHVKITTSRNGKIINTKNVDLVGIKDRENLVTEGPNIILQRLLILQRRTMGSMIVQSLAYTGKVVRAKYSDLGSGWENVRGRQVKTWGIRRLTYIYEDEERQFESLFNKHGRLILRCQPDSPQALIPLWFEGVSEFDKFGNSAGLYSPYAWACDAELHSKYLVKKEELTYDHRRYITDNPEVRALLSDYLQCILFQKPQNVFEFTKKFFESFMNLRGKNAKRERKKSHNSTLGTYSTTSTNSDDDSSSTSDDDEEWLGEGEGEGEDFDMDEYEEMLVNEPGIDEGKASGFTEYYHNAPEQIMVTEETGTE